jgi:site-specific recombinase XerD
MKNSRRRKIPKTVLKLADLEQAKSAVLNSLPSPESRRSYEFAIRNFVDWYCSEPRLALNRIVVTRYRMQLEQLHLAASTINQRLAAVRRLAYEASDAGLLSPELAAGIRRVKGVRQLGVRLGNWLTAEQSRALIEAPPPETLRGMRDRAILAVLLGCGLRRSEVVHLEVVHMQQREEHWAVVDLVGKGGHVRTVPVPNWVKKRIDEWTRASGTVSGRLFRSIGKNGVVWGQGLTEKVVWYVVKNFGKAVGIEKVAPHDLRRTCARLCHVGGGELEQKQFLLGHVSVQTTERYLGCKQKLRDAVNDRLGIEPAD